MGSGPTLFRLHVPDQPIPHSVGQRLPDSTSSSLSPIPAWELNEYTTAVGKRYGKRIWPKLKSFALRLPVVQGTPFEYGEQAPEKVRLWASVSNGLVPDVHIFREISGIVRSFHFTNEFVVLVSKLSSLENLAFSRLESLGMSNLSRKPRL